jgi:3-hydroxybutyryl-CoA dehydrogenase
MSLPEPPLRIGVCGIGQMGASAAVCFSRGGFPVLLWARDPARLEAVVPRLEEQARFLDTHVGPASVAAAPIETTPELERLCRESDVILECIAEDMDQKAALLRRLSPAVERGAILASCTSGLSITEMGRKSGTGRRLVGAHFWNPPHLMPLVEVVRGAETEEGIEATISTVLRLAGKIPVACKDVPGFIGNRLFHALLREAAYLVQNGICSAEDVDRVARLTFGLRLPAVGPCENMDLVGLDLVAQIQSYLLEDLCDAKSAMPVIEGLRRSGRSGIKAGQGFHDWSVRDPTKLIEERDRQIARQLRFLDDRARHSRD